MASEGNHFQFCTVCRRNHNQGRKHVYGKKHCHNTNAILIKYGKKIDEARKTINTPSVMNGELEPGSKFWCHFCHMDVKKHVTDGEVTIQYGGVFEHLASSDHVRKMNSWWVENGAKKEEKVKFLLSHDELRRFKEFVKEKLENLQTEIGKNYDKSVLAIQEQEKRQKFAASQPPEPCKPVPIIYATVKNRYGVMQNPTGFHDGQRVWGGGVVKYSVRSDQWYPWDFDLEDGRKAPKGAKKLRVTVETTKNGEISQNIHTGATPPWLLPDDDETTHSSAIGPSFSEFQKHAERLKKRGKNPYRVGANFDRTCKVDNEWLPSFGGVWNSGPRWQTRRSFKSRRGKQT